MPDGLELSSMLSLRAARVNGLLASRLVDLASLAPVEVPIDQSEAPVTGPEGLRDTALLTAADGTTYYLPRYRLRRAGDVYDVRVEDGGDGRWWFRVVLDLVPAPELGDAGRTATALPGSVAARLTFGHPVAQTVEATEMGEVAGGVSLGVALDLEERDALLWALKSEQGASLVVVRAVRVAVPSGEAAPVIPWIVGIPRVVMPAVVTPPVDPVPDPVQPDVVLRGTTLPLSAVTPLLRARVADTARVADAARVAEVRDHRTAPVVRDHREAVDAPVRRRPDVAEGVVVRDHRRPRWRRLPIEPVPTDRRTVRHVDATPEHVVPLRFDPVVHPYVYPGAATGRPATFERIVVPDAAGRSHTYLRNPAVPHVFHHLPDAFRLARTTTPPLRPALAFAVSDDGASVTLTAQVVPAVDTARLTAAAEALAAHVPERDGVRAPVELRPVQAPARVTLGLLDTGVGDADDDPVDLVNGFLLAETFAFERGLARRQPGAVRGHRPARRRGRARVRGGHARLVGAAPRGGPCADRCARAGPPVRPLRRPGPAGPGARAHVVRLGARALPVGRRDPGGPGGPVHRRRPASRARRARPGRPGRAASRGGPRRRRRGGRRLHLGPGRRRRDLRRASVRACPSSSCGRPPTPRGCRPAAARTSCARTTWRRASSPGVTGGLSSGGRTSDHLLPPHPEVRPPRCPSAGPPLRRAYAGTRTPV